MNKGDRKDADTAEDGPNRIINRVPREDSYLIDGITEVAIGNNRAKQAERSQAASGVMSAQITSHISGLPFQYI